MYTAGNAWSGSSHYSLPRIPRDMNLHISRIVSTFLPAACRVNINRRSKSTDECERRTPRVRNSVLTDLAPSPPPSSHQTVELSRSKISLTTYFQSALLTSRQGHIQSVVKFVSTSRIILLYIQMYIYLNTCRWNQCFWIVSL